MLVLHAFGMHLGLRPRPDDVAEQDLAKREFAWVVVQVEAGSVHRVREPDPGIGIGEPERATGSRGSERFVGRTEPELREGFDVAERECRLDLEHLVAQPVSRRHRGLGQRIDSARGLCHFLQRSQQCPIMSAG